ncbi:zinc finger protein OZF [Anabrus simplex]|uniref:zinc finger protein OZF n=1 Tax=Anabrus simplex TaxID=316456 RepID=UPI0035A3309F
MMNVAKDGSSEGFSFVFVKCEPNFDNGPEKDLTMEIKEEINVEEHIISEHTSNNAKSPSIDIVDLQKTDLSDPQWKEKDVHPPGSMVPQRTDTSSNQKRMFSCSLCGIKFMESSDDSSMHKQVNALCCPPCGKTLKLKGGPKNDDSEVRGKEFHSCSVCNRSFKYISRLQQHLSSHTTERPFSCNLCGKSFKLRSHLDTHNLLHTTDRPYSCEFCNKSFKMRKTLGKHLTLHSEERPFRCNSCNKTFKLIAMLKRHLQFHTDERPHVCITCGKSFKLRAHMKVHMLLHADECKYRCNTCNKSFKQPSSLRTHVLRQKCNS